MAVYYYASTHGPHVNWSPAGAGWYATPQSVVGGFDLNGGNHRLQGSLPLLYCNLVIFVPSLTMYSSELQKLFM